MRKQNNEEHEIQAGIVKAAKSIPGCEWLHAIPNGGKRGIKTAIYMKAEGVKPGVADLFLPRPGFYDALHKSHYPGCPMFHGLYIEVKKPKGLTINGKPSPAGRQSKEQKAFQEYVESQGYRLEIIETVQEGIDLLLSYVGRK